MRSILRLPNACTRTIEQFDHVIECPRGCVWIGPNCDDRLRIELENGGRKFHETLVIH